MILCAKRKGDGIPISTTFYDYLITLLIVPNLSYPYLSCCLQIVSLLLMMGSWLKMTLISPHP